MKSLKNSWKYPNISTPLAGNVVSTAYAEAAAAGQENLFLIVGLPSIITVHLIRLSSNMQVIGCKNSHVCSQEDRLTLTSGLPYGIRL